MSREAFERNDLLISHEDMHAVLGVFLVFPFGFQHELLENVIVAGDDTNSDRDVSGGTGVREGCGVT